MVHGFNFHLNLAHLSDGFSNAKVVKVVEWLCTNSTKSSQLNIVLWIAHLMLTQFYFIALSQLDMQHIVYNPAGVIWLMRVIQFQHVFLY